MTVGGGHVGRETEGGVGFVGAERNHGVISNDGVRERVTNGGARNDM